MTDRRFYRYHASPRRRGTYRPLAFWLRAVGEGAVFIFVLAVWATLAWLVTG